MSGLAEEITQATADGDYEEVVRLARMLDQEDRTDLIQATELLIRALRQANEEKIWDYLGKAQIRFWMCPVEEHSKHQVDTPIVEWRNGVAYCLAPGCEHHSS